MNCKKSDLGMFIDWIHAANEYMFENVVAVRINIVGGAQSDAFAMGFLEFVPTHIIGILPDAKHKGKNVSDFFQANLMNMNEGDSSTNLIIEIDDPDINIIIQNIMDHRIETVKMKTSPCIKSDNKLTIKTEGDDGLSYEIILSARKVLALPYQICH